MLAKKEVTDYRSMPLKEKGTPTPRDSGRDDREGVRLEWGWSGGCTDVAWRG
jgi:hypothetical protein